MRAIYYYHTQVMGWYDIGYNFLIDKYGTIYEGRYGSIAGNVIGAQVLGLQVHSMGVALIGTYRHGEPDRTRGPLTRGPCWPGSSIWPTSTRWAPP